MTICLPESWQASNGKLMPKTKKRKAVVAKVKNAVEVSPDKNRNKRGRVYDTTNWSNMHIQIINSVVEASFTL